MKIGRALRLACLTLALVLLTTGCGNGGDDAQEQVPAQELDDPSSPYYSALELSFDFSQSSYSVGEEFEGCYMITNNGQSFDAFVLVTSWTEASPADKGTSRSRYVLDKGTWREGLLAFHAEQGQWRISDSFDGVGTYSYKLQVFDAAALESKMNKDPMDLWDRELSELIPIKAAVGSVKVKAG